MAILFFYKNNFKKIEINLRCFNCYISNIKYQISTVDKYAEFNLLHTSTHYKYKYL